MSYNKIEKKRIENKIKAFMRQLEGATLFRFRYLRLIRAQY